MKLLILLLTAALAVAQDRLPLPPSGSVTLTLNEYNKLADQAAKPTKKIETPPAPYALNRAELSTPEAAEGEVAEGIVRAPSRRRTARLD